MAGSVVTAEILPPSKPQSGHRIADYGWKPGQSGNPAGRSRRFHEVQAAAQDKSVQAIEKLTVLMDSTDERVSIIACNSILDRAFGKPKEQKTEDSQGLRPDLSALSPDDLATVRRIMAKLAGAAATEPDDKATA